VEVLSIAVGLLATLVVVLFLYNLSIQLQLRSMNRQLVQRLRETTRQPLSLELINGELNRLAANINTAFKVEENRRLEGIREEKRFKEMIANLSHDLRTPLTAIKGYQQLLEKSGLDSGQLKKLQTAQKYADELGALIEQFFEYAYLLHAEPELQLERIHFTALVTECLAEAVTGFESRKLAVSVEGEPSVFVHADRKMTVRIVQNLIRNCMVHSAGDVEVRLQAGERAVLQFRNPVKDASQLDVERLFDRFYTGDQARKRTTGLGLSIVRLLAEQMGGHTSAVLDNGFLEIRVELPL
jgi:signal transduction histidine kinase